MKTTALFCLAEAADDRAEHVATRPTLTLEGANAVVAAAVAEARRRDAGGAIAVVDDGGHLVAFQRLDGTFAAGAPVSLGKARSAAIFRKPTRAFEDSIAKGRGALVAVDELTPLQGGVPILFDGQVIGGIGVSGAHSQFEDEEIALAGAGALSIATTTHP
jgi:glc operon protein GlcG